MIFEVSQAAPVSRRAFVIMPVALAGMIAAVERPERKLGNVAQDGTGAEVGLVLFSDRGDRAGFVETKKLVRSDEVWKRELAPIEFAVTRCAGTEFAFTGRYWDSHQPGIYRCVCCGNAVFRSQDKFDSGTGWPSFSAPIANENVMAKEDRALAVARVEVLCRKCDAHLGHVFHDGPPPSGMRYCLNSAALRFVKLA